METLLILEIKDISELAEEDNKEDSKEDSKEDNDIYELKVQLIEEKCKNKLLKKKI